MKLRPRRDLLRPAAWLCVALLAAAPVRAAQALNPARWPYRQTLTVTAPGLVRAELPPATLDAARPDLADLRLLDPAGREVPSLLVRPSRAPPEPFTTRSFGVTLTDRATVATIGSDGQTPLAVVVLETPASAFLKSATVALSADGERWETIATGAPAFRQSGAEQLDFCLGHRPAALVRVTLDDSRSRPVPITGARLVPAPLVDESPETRLVAARIVRRDEFAAETVLTLDLGAAHLPLAALKFTTAEPLFLRSVRVAVRELRGTSAVEHTLATGSIYRVSIDGAPSRTQLELRLAATPPARELLVHVANGDSPPLAIEAIEVRCHPVWLVCQASQTGPHLLLSGHSRAAAPRYDVARFERDLRRAPATLVACGPVEPNPAFVPAEPLAGVRLEGVPFDPAAWKFRRTVRLAASGVQQLELDLDALARMQPSGADLRLLRDGRQLPYLIERPALARPLALALIPAPDPQRPTLGRWEIQLPRPRVPLNRLTLTTTTPFFHRRLRLYERIADGRDSAYDHTLAEVDWSRQPDGPGALTLTLSAAPQTGTLVLETDNGDNPPLALAPAQAAYAVVRLLFKADAGSPLMLAYGNAMATAPRYDLALVASQILRAEKHIATLVPGDAPATAAGRTLFDGHRRTILFWGALALVVVVLFVVVARLLPKPPPA